MKTAGFILALYILPGSADMEIVRIGYFDGRDHCRAEARAIIRTLRKENPDWVNLGFRCRLGRPSDGQVTPLSDFLPNA